MHRGEQVTKIMHRGVEIDKIYHRGELVFEKATTARVLSDQDDKEEAPDSLVSTPQKRTKRSIFSRN